MDLERTDCLTSRSAVVATVFELKTNCSHCILESKEQVICTCVKVKTIRRISKRYLREDVETFLIYIIHARLAQFHFVRCCVVVENVNTILQKILSLQL